MATGGQRVMRWVILMLEIFAGVLLMMLMLMTCLDVIGRYFFNSPLWGGFEITEALLAVLIFTGLPLVTIRNEHIEIDLLETPHFARRAHFGLVNLVGAGFSAFLGYRLWLRGDQLFSAGETTLQLGFKLAYIAYAMSAMMALTTVAFLLVAILQPAPRDKVIF